MGNRLFVGNLSWNTDDNSLKAAFENYGEVTDAKVIMDRDTQRSRGFGFVTFASESDASKAMEGLNEQDIDGRNVRVNEANERGSRGGGGSGGGGGGGGGNRRDGGGRDNRRDNDGRGRGGRRDDW